MHAGWIVGIVGTLMGLVGGVIGTYFGVKNTNGPRERAFMLRIAIVGWGAVVLFLVLMVVLPNPYRFLLWIPYSILLPLGIILGNRAQQRIRREEAQREGPGAPPPDGLVGPWPPTG